MALNDILKKEICDLAERFVGAFVKSIRRHSCFTVQGELCNSVDEALVHSLKKCSRLKVAPEDGDEQEKVLKNALEEAIKRLS